jgi:hypothetical protein
MARIRGLEVYPVTEGVEVWKLGVAQMPVDEALQKELVCLDGPVDLTRGRQSRWGRRGVRSLKVANLDLDGFGRFRGMVVARSGTRLIRYLLKAARPTRGTVLATWLQGRALGEASMAELGELLERAWLLGHDIEGMPLGRKLPKGGLALLPESTDIRLANVTIEGSDWWLDRIHSPGKVSAAVVDRIVTIGDHRVPQPLHLRRNLPGARYGWYDGVYAGHTSSLDAVPVRLLERVEEQGWMRAVADPLRPLADLEVRFLLRRPTLDERPRAVAPTPPKVCGHPAILIPATEPVPLIDPGGRALDVPLVTDPEEAFAVLGRAYNGRIYVPHAHCLDPFDVRCHATRAEWLVGVMPRCLVV